MEMTTKPSNLLPLRRLVDCETYLTLYKDQLQRCQEARDRFAEEVAGLFEKEGISTTRVTTMSPRVMIEGLLIDMESNIGVLAGLRPEDSERDRAINLAIREALQGCIEEVVNALSDVGGLSEPMGERTVFPHRQLWAAPVDDNNERLIAALKSNPETSVLVQENYNSNRLSSYVRELEQDADGNPRMPEHLVGVLKATERFEVRTRKA